MIWGCIITSQHIDLASTSSQKDEKVVVMILKKT
jgi:hypothetical protein